MCSLKANSKSHGRPRLYGVGHSNMNFEGVHSSPDTFQTCINAERYRTRLTDGGRLLAATRSDTRAAVVDAVSRRRWPCTSTWNWAETDVQAPNKTRRRAAVPSCCLASASSCWRRETSYQRPLYITHNQFQ